MYLKIRYKNLNTFNMKYIYKIKIIYYYIN